MLRVTINGREYVCASGGSILEALRTLGVEIPALCDDPRLAPVAVCRMCLVNINRQPHPVPACSTELVDGMEIATHTDQIEHLRRANMRLLAWSYPREALKD